MDTKEEIEILKEAIKKLKLSNKPYSEDLLQEAYIYYKYMDCKSPAEAIKKALKKFMPKKIMIKGKRINIKEIPCNFKSSINSYFNSYDEKIDFLNSITPLQKKIFELIREGYNYNEIAKILKISKRSVYYQIEKIKNKFLDD